MKTHTMRGAGTRAPAGLLRVLAMLFCALALLIWAPGVSAHASLMASTPTAGAVLPVAPTQARLTFNEPVSPLVLKIVQPDGTVIDLHQIQSRDNGLLLSLPALRQQGTYALSWRVISADGHPVGGALTFSIGISSASVPVQTDVTPLSLDVLIWLSRLVWYIGLFIGIGLAVFHAVNTAGSQTRQIGLWTLALGAVATLLNVGLLGLDALDRPLSGLLGIDTWRTASATSFGLSAALTLMALACAAVVWLAKPSFAQRLMAGAAIIALGTALAASGHASAALPPWLARPAVGLHGVAVTLWIGSLVPLAYALSDSPNLKLIKLFSRFIPVILLALFTSGGVLIYLQLDSVSALWLTTYGRILAAKLSLLLVLLALGAYNRFRLTNAVLHSDIAPRRAMRRIIYLECAVAVAILALVAMWRFTPPPRAMAAEPPAASVVSAHIHSDAAIADLTLTPSRDQTATLIVRLSNPDLTPLTAQEVDVVFSNPPAGIEPITFAAARANDGIWQVNDLELPHQDDWHLRINALVSDFERITLETTLELSK